MSLVKQESKQFNLFEFSSTTKSYFGIVATLVLLIVLLLLIYPAINRITTLNRELSDARIVKATLETKLANLGLARNNLEEARNDLFVLDLALPIGSDLTPYLKDIEGMAKNSKLKISAVQFTDVPLSTPSAKIGLKTKQIDYSITFEGSFPNFTKFLAEIENFIRTSEVSDIAIVKDPEKGLTHTFGASSYYLGTEFAPPPITSQGTSPQSLEGLQ